MLGLPVAQRCHDDEKPGTRTGPRFPQHRSYHFEAYVVPRPSPEDARGAPGDLLTTPHLFRCGQTLPVDPRPAVCIWVGHRTVQAQVLPCSSHDQNLFGQIPQKRAVTVSTVRDNQKPRGLLSRNLFQPLQKQVHTLTGKNTETTFHLLFLVRLVCFLRCPPPRLLRWRGLLKPYRDSADRLVQTSRSDQKGELNEPDRSSEVHVKRQRGRVPKSPHSWDVQTGLLPDGIIQHTDHQIVWPLGIPQSFLKESPKQFLRIPQPFGKERVVSRPVFSAVQAHANKLTDGLPSWVQKVCAGQAPRSLKGPSLDKARPKDPENAVECIHKRHGSALWLSHSINANVLGPTFTKRSRLWTRLMSALTTDSRFS